MSVHEHQHDNPIVMIEHDAFRASFERLYEETMRLIEETASYIDTEGKQVSCSLPKDISRLYAREAVFLSTRLMQIASRLFLLRAKREGDMSPETIQSEIAKIPLHTPSLRNTTTYWHELPRVFRNFVAHSLRLEERVRYMSHDMEQTSFCPLENANPVGEQIQLLKIAFRRP